MLRFLVYVTNFCLLLGPAQALVCQEGWYATFEYPKNVSKNITTMKETKCPSGYPQRCLRGEGKLLFLVGSEKVEVTAHSELCDNDAACNEPCQEFAKRQSIKLAALMRAKKIRISRVPDLVSLCKKACCDVDNCNNRTVDEIVQENKNSISRDATTSIRTPGGGTETIHDSQRAFFVYSTLVISLITSI